MCQGVGVWDIGLAGLRKVGEKLDRISNVDDNQERRPSVGGREGLRVLFRLIAGAEHGFIPTGRPAYAGTPAVRRFEE
jgi:hypothetical protein